MAFDGTGDYLAVGDRAGRVIVFKHSGPIKNSRYFDYRYFAEIQSHEPEFDHLKSIELEEKINHIQFLNTRAPKQSNFGSQLQFLSTNDRIIKLWNVEYRVRREPVTTCEVAEDADFGGQCEQIILLPETEIVSEGFEGIEKKEFKNCHQYNINSLSVSSDGETFLSADDLRVNLWHLDNNNLAYNVVDLKP